MAQKKKAGPVRKAPVKEEGKGLAKAVEKTSPKVDKAFPPAIEFPIVGIGASAGGLEAFGDLLKELSPNTGMAFVYIQHLAPKHASMLNEILARETKMRVLVAKNNMIIEPDTVYVIPPDNFLGIQNGKIDLITYREWQMPRMPIDYFFRSLAKERGGRSIGIVLSGTASDGTMGLMAIKAEGGITFAQDDKTAKYDGMPRSAVSAGVVDFVLSPGEIAHELARISQHPAVTEGKLKLSEDTIISQDVLDRIFLLLRNVTGVDFSYYKPSTIKRRIKRRMILHKLERSDEYLKFLSGHSAEIDHLYEDILINVTSFFRDKDSFEILRERVFPKITRDRMHDNPIRIWVPGCSTGEEAYSIAICLLEFLGDRAAGTPIQIFATDIDEKALEKARAGKYPESITQDISQERLRKHFIKLEKGFQISKQIRDMCVFARHNLVKDPPFSKLDLISCRNLLIYLGPTLQKKAFPIFHYALSPNGYLMLGSSETIGRFADLFSPVDKKQKIYLKKAADRQAISFAELEREEFHPEPQAKKEPGRTDLLREADKLMLNRYAPPSVLVNQNMEILKFSGKTGTFLEHSPGEASLNLFRLAKDGIAMELRKMMAMALKQGSARKDGIAFKDGDRTRTVSLEIIPVRGGGEKDYIIIFEEALSPEAVQEKFVKGKQEAKKPKGQSVREMDELRQELDSTKSYLQSIIEEQETTNEELRSANEEIQAANEELQSTNEELETAKEELQSANEELATVNDELESRNQELSRVNDDLNNLLSSVSLPIVILERDLRIKRFTPVAKKALNLIPTDIGRPISDIKPNIEIKDLDQLVSHVIDTVTVSTQDVQDNMGRWYSLRIHPYLTIENKVDGAVMLLIDIDAFKSAMKDAEVATDYGKAIEASISYPVLILDKEFKILSSSSLFLELFGVDKKEIIGNGIYTVLGGRLNVSGLKEILEQTEKTGKPGECFTKEIHIVSGDKKFHICAKPATINRTGERIILLEFREP